MSVQRFSCSLDKFSKIISGYICLFGIVLITIPFFTSNDDQSLSERIFLATGFFILMLSLVSYFLSPVSYTLSEKGLTIERKLGQKKIHSDDIVQIRKPEEKELSWPIRTFGNGGLFGYTGRYYNKHIGAMIWYCSRRDRQVIIERKSALPMVISPDEPARLIWAWGELKRPPVFNE